VKKIKTFIINILLSFFSIFIVLLFFEIIIRIFGNQGLYSLAQYPYEMFDYSRVTMMRPHFEGQFPKSEIQGNIKINTQGIRDYERSYEKASHFRILGLGDSFCFGHGVELEDTYLTLFENKLRKEFGSNMEVVKAGVPGTGPQTYLNVMAQEGIKYEPDIVIVSFFVGNDINDIKLSNHKQNDIDLESKVKQDVSENKTNIKKTGSNNSKSTTYIKDFLRRHVHLYSFVVDRLKTNPFIQSFLQKKNIASGLIGSYVIDVLKKDYDDIYLRKWEETYTVFDSIISLSPNTAILIIPTREQVNDTRREKALKQLGYKSEDIDIYKPNNLLKAYCKNRNIYCIDLLDAFRNTYQKTEKSLYFKIDPHFNTLGHELAAEVLFTHIIHKIEHLLDSDNPIN